MRKFKKITPVTMDHYDKWAEEVVINNTQLDAFEIITSKLEMCENKYLGSCLFELNFLQYEKVLDWIEENIGRARRVQGTWGLLALTSQFTWQRADRWLQMGRPLSLVALDALYDYVCDRDRLNQRAFQKELIVKLQDEPSPEIIANRLTQYLESDNVPRVRNKINAIIHTLYKV